MRNTVLQKAICGDTATAKRDAIRHRQTIALATMDSMRRMELWARVRAREVAIAFKIKASVHPAEKDTAAAVAKSKSTLKMVRRK
tara:strand:+ start:668 stop:922 length:255 start_codon:yes stop_codon:yes gene_type:complete